jgi:restriction system protein
MCPVCGWWLIDKQFIFSTKCQTWHSNFGASGALKLLDLANIQTPMAEVRNYLVARYEDRLSIDPLKFEQVVGSVFASIGYKARVTAATNDGGIDVILSDDAGTSVGVQVKRHKGKIKVEQIRSLLSAMVLNGHTHGVFVTTSTFQRGAYSCAERAKQHGALIELMDADRFLDLLKIAQVRDFEEKAQTNRWLPYSGKPELGFAFQLPLNSI